MTRHPQKYPKKKGLLDYAGVRILISSSIVVALIATCAVIAGQLDWIRGWLYILVFTIGQGIRTLYIKRKSPELYAKRAKVGQDTKTWDKALLILFGLTYITILIVASFDFRYKWSEMNYSLWYVGLTVYAVSVAIMCWAMTENRHFEKTVRIQKDRGHTVVDSGPYRIARHPGYIGTILGMALSTPLLLGSWWSFIPALLSTAVIVYRTSLEDRTLQRELPGYKDYAQKVHYRLLPGIW